MSSGRTWLRRLANGLIVAGLVLVAIPPAQKGIAAVAQARLRAAYMNEIGAPVHAVGAVTKRNEAELDVRDEVAGTKFGVVISPPDVRNEQESLSHLFTGAIGLHRNDPVVTTPIGYERNQASRSGVARLLIPSIHVDAIVVNGTSDWQLATGPGFYPEGSLPHLGGNVAVAGHRTTYGAWFRHVDRLAAGDAIYLIFDGKEYRYEVERVWITASDDWSVIAPMDEHVLTLTTCHPPGSSKERLIVRARWVETNATTEQRL